MNTHLSDSTITKKLLAPVAAGQTTQTSAAMDCRGAEGFRALVAFGAITSGAATSVKLQGSDDDGVADAYADLEGSSITVADDDDLKLVIADLLRPPNYVKVVILRATQNSVIDYVLGESYGHRTNPVTQDASVATLEKSADLAEGTA